MTARCPHDNINITEFGSWLTIHIREDERWFHENQPGEYNCRLYVQCRDCGLTRVYWKGSSALPKWLRLALDELGIYHSWNRKERR